MTRRLEKKRIWRGMSKMMRSQSRIPVTKTGDLETAEDQTQSRVGRDPLRRSTWPEKVFVFVLN